MIFYASIKVIIVKNELIVNEDSCLENEPFKNLGTIEHIQEHIQVGTHSLK